jgi:GntR family transcriptional repressor for pyruvate dehydrogenase complex
MRKAIEGMKQNRDELEVCVDRDMDFHNAVVKASQNLVFEIMLGPLVELLKGQRREQIRFRGIDMIIEYHTMIMRAIEEKNPDRAQQSMDAHLLLAEEDVMKSIRLGTPPASGQPQDLQSRMAASIAEASLENTPRSP